MSRPDDSLDISLLRNNKTEFVLRCQETVSIIVKYYIAKGLFKPENFEDIKQTVYVDLIGRLTMIEKNYTNDTLLKTYLSVVIRNICLRIYKRDKSKYTGITISAGRTKSGDYADRGVLISDEIHRFAIAMKYFHKHYYKTLVCLKMHFSIPIERIELEQCFLGITQTDIELLQDAVKNQLQGENEFEQYHLLTHMMNKYGLTSRSESIQHWINRTVQRLIALMNGDPPTRAHTKDSIKFLLERYSEQNADNE